MERTTLGKTGLQISRLGVGLAEIGSLADVSVAGIVAISWPIDLNR